jgi:ribonuclease P protein component
VRQKKLTFQKSERLIGEVRIKELFEEGEFLLSYPFRIGYKIVSESDVPIKVLISVPKKRFKHAVDRNHIKRLIREAYRLNKEFLYDMLREKKYSIHLAINYISSDKLVYSMIQKKWLETIDKLAKSLP